MLQEKFYHQQGKMSYSWKRFEIMIYNIVISFSCQENNFLFQFSSEKVIWVITKGKNIFFRNNRPETFHTSLPGGGVENSTLFLITDSLTDFRN